MYHPNNYARAFARNSKEEQSGSYELRSFEKKNKNIL